MDLVLRCDRLYEGRIASLQRAVAMFVMFHELGKRVQDFVSCDDLHVRVLVRVHLSYTRLEQIRLGVPLLTIGMPLLR